MNKPYYSLPEVEQALNVSKVTLWRWHRSGKLRMETVGGRRVIPVSELNSHCLMNARVAAGLPRLTLGNHPLRQAELQSIARSIADVIERTGLSVIPERLHDLVRGEAAIQPAFWRHILQGLEKFGNRSPAWVPSDAEVADIKEVARREGIGFFEAALKLHRSPAAEKSELEVSTTGKCSEEEVGRSAAGEQNLRSE
jgi:hypothetical protein